MKRTLRSIAGAFAMTLVLLTGSLVAASPAQAEPQQPPWGSAELTRGGSYVHALGRTGNWPFGNITVQIIVFQETFVPAQTITIVINKTKTCYNAFECSLSGQTPCICGAVYEMFLYVRHSNGTSRSWYDDLDI